MLEPRCKRPNTKKIGLTTDIRPSIREVVETDHLRHNPLNCGEDAVVPFQGICHLGT